MSQRDDLCLHCGLAAKPDKKGIPHHYYKVEHSPDEANRPRSTTSTIIRRMRFSVGKVLCRDGLRHILHPLLDQQPKAMLFDLQVLFNLPDTNEKYGIDGRDPRMSFHQCDGCHFMQLCSLGEGGRLLLT
jgi:hypothetical protein